MWFLEDSRHEEQEEIQSLPRSLEEKDDMHQNREELRVVERGHIKEKGSTWLCDEQGVKNVESKLCAGADLQYPGLKSHRNHGLSVSGFETKLSSCLTDQSLKEKIQPHSLEESTFVSCCQNPRS